MRYVALLRAINVGGHLVKMDRLRGLFEELELADVETFIASGNVTFQSRASEAPLEKKIEKHLEAALGYDVETFIRPVTELPAIIAAQPFASKEEKAHGLYVGFLKSEPTREQRDQLAALSSPQTEFYVGGREFYWLSHISMADTPVTGKQIERAIGRTTMRSIVSLRKLAKKVGVRA